MPCANCFRPRLPNRPSFTILTYTVSPSFPVVSPPFGPIPYHMTNQCPLQSGGQMPAGWVTLLHFCALPQRKIQLQGGITSITLRGEGHQFFVGTEESHIYRVNISLAWHIGVTASTLSSQKDVTDPKERALWAPRLNQAP